MKHRLRLSIDYDEINNDSDPSTMMQPRRRDKIDFDTALATTASHEVTSIERASVDCAADARLMMPRRLQRPPTT